MSEKRTILSRPRTKVYDCNYNIGENYYKPMMDQLDRKYSTPTSFATSTFTTPLLTDSRLRKDEDFGFSNRRPSSSPFSRDFEPAVERVRSRFGSETRSLEEDLEDEMASSVRKLRSLRTGRSASAEKELTPSLLNGLSNYSCRRSHLDSTGLNSRLQDSLEEEILKKRTIKMPTLFDEESHSGLSKWTSLRAPLMNSLVDSTVSIRARQSKARLTDLEKEMETATQRDLAREKRMSNFKSMIEGEDTFTNAFDSFQSRKSSMISNRNKF